MIEFLQNFHFLRPWILLFLFLPIGLYLKKFKYLNTVSSWEDVCDKNLLSYLLVRNNKPRTISFQHFVYLALVCATLSAAGPTWKKVEIPTFVIENPNMFVLSLAQDMQLKDVTPSRLDRAKFMLSDITDNLPQGQFGIEVYSNEPYIITPFTDDINLVKNLLPQITPNIVPDQGDRLDRAINLALEHFQNANFSTGNIILFASDVGQRFDLALETAKQAQAHNYNIHVIDTSFTGNEKLKLLADTGNGIYMNVQENSPTKLLQQINNINEEHVKISENLRSNYIDFGYYLLFIPLLCVLLFFRKGFLVFVLCLLTTQANAGFLKNNNQEGLSLYHEQKYDEAFKKFDDTNWRGVTLYKQDKLEEALTEFEKRDDELSFYNRGVILTKLCKYKEALEFFDKSLQLNPTNEDALYNKDVLVALLEKAKSDPSVLECQNNQQQNQSSDDQQQNNDNSNNQQSSQSNSQNNDSDSEQQNENKEQNQQNNQESSSAENDEKRDNNEQNEDSLNQEKQDNSDQTQEDKNKSEQTNNNSSENQPSSQNDNTTSDEKAKPNSEKNNSSNNNDDNSSDNNDDNTSDNNQSSSKTEQNAELAEAKQGDDNEKYDEEALAMQRQYREIPEDVGGLLREFIKKEYMKGRYNDK